MNLFQLKLQTLDLPDADFSLQTFDSKPSPLLTQWLRYHAHTKPHFFWSVAMGLTAPLLLLATPLRRKFLYEDHTPIPVTYPLPTRPRDKELSGFDDE